MVQQKRKRRVPDADRRAMLAEIREVHNTKALSEVFNSLRQRLEYNLCKVSLTSDDLLELFVKPEDRIVVKRAMEIGNFKKFYFDDLVSIINYPIPEEAQPYTQSTYVPRVWFNLDDRKIPFMPVNYGWLNSDRSLPARVKLDEWVTNNIMVENKYQTLAWLSNRFLKMGMSLAQASFYWSSMRYICEQAKIHVGRMPDNIPNITPEMRRVCVLANQIVAQALLLPAVPENVTVSGVVAMGAFGGMTYKVVP